MMMHHIRDMTLTEDDCWEKKEKDKFPALKIHQYKQKGEFVKLNLL